MGREEVHKRLGEEAQTIVDAMMSCTEKCECQLPTSHPPPRRRLHHASLHSAQLRGRSWLSHSTRTSLNLY